LAGKEGGARTKSVLEKVKKERHQHILHEGACKLVDKSDETGETMGPSIEEKGVLDEGKEV